MPQTAHGVPGLESISAVPDAQSTHSMPAPAAYVPLLQAEHGVDASISASTYPGGQGSQSIAPAPVYVPFPHAMQILVELKSKSWSPGAHKVHIVAPVSNSASVECPAVHCMHSVSPTFSWNHPGWQLLQATVGVVETFQYQGNAYMTSGGKIEHDAEQLEYLVQQGKLPRDFLAAHRIVLCHVSNKNLFRLRYRRFL